MFIDPKLPIGKIIVLCSEQYVGEKEIPGNKGWYNKVIQSFMNSFWRIGNPWCASFRGAIWEMAYKIKYGHLEQCAALIRDLKKLHSANSQQMFRNFQNSSIFTTSDSPVIGASYVWAYTSNGKLTIHGHTGTAVQSIISSETVKLKGENTKTYYSWNGIEGNAKDMVWLGKRDNKPKPGQIFKGFIHPRDFTDAEIIQRYS